MKVRNILHFLSTEERKKDQIKEYFDHILTLVLKNTQNIILPYHSAYVNACMESNVTTGSLSIRMLLFVSIVKLKTCLPPSARMDAECVLQSQPF